MIFQSRFVAKASREHLLYFQSFSCILSQSQTVVNVKPITRSLQKALMYENKFQVMLYDWWKVQTLFQKEKAKNAHSPKQQQVLHVLFATKIFLPQLMINEHKLPYIHHSVLVFALVLPLMQMVRHQQLV